MSIRYRADIDGLRAVAVVAVILYHFRFTGFSGGFVGVDVFFVVSGFLIAALIEREIEERRFSLIYFYERRIRRIFPALILLLLVVSALAYLEMFPLAYRRFGQSVTAASVFLSNVEFWREGVNYFDIPSTDKPLLHTWSLAVEEQFYLLFPPLMLLLAGHRKLSKFGTFLILIVISLGFSVWSTFALAGGGFYLFPSRIWELLLGALIAVGAVPRISNGYVNTVLAALGLALIAGAVALYTGNTEFPGIAALVPCAGACLIIYAGLGDGTAINRILSARPIVFVGLISYSLYLWHWPLYVFATYHLARALTASESISLIAVSFVIAGLSWRFVEQPFRRPGGVASRRHIFLQAMAATLILGASGMAIYLTNGAPQRFAPDVQALLAPEMEFRTAACDSGLSEETIAGPMCKIGRPGGVVTFLFWGDSHARALSPGVASAADRFGATGLLVTRAGCPPLLGQYYSLESGIRCREHNDNVLNFLQGAKVDTVILFAHWTAYAEGTVYDTEGVSFVGYTQDDETRDLSLEENRRVFVRSLSRTVAAIRANGQRVVVVAPVPEIGLPVPTTLARRHMRGLSEDIGPTLAQFEARNEFVLRNLRAMEGTFHVVYPHEMLCLGVRCSVAHDGKPLYIDGTHLHAYGAQLLSAIFEPVFLSPS